MAADEISQENLISDEVKMALDIKFWRKLREPFKNYLADFAEYSGFL